MRLLFLILALTFLTVSSEGRIRLRKVKDAPKVCAVMKEDSALSRADKKILATEKNSLIIEEQVSLVGDLGTKTCEWPVDQFYQIGEPKDITFYIDEYKGLIVAYKKSEQGINQVKINIDNCQIQEYQTLSEVGLPKCDPPKKRKVKKSKLKPGQKKIVKKK